LKLRTESRQLTVNVESCPRCGGDHVGGPGEDGRSGALFFYPLANPESRDDLWAWCPEARQPVLASTEDIGD
jgi:hypothetical protein